MGSVLRVACVILLAAGVAAADPFLDFTINSGASGSIYYSGGGAPLVGSNIEVSSVVGTNGVPINNNLLQSCISCTLSFTTGGLLSTSSTGWTFNTGGTLTLSGWLDLNGNNMKDAGDAIGSLLSGTFAWSPPVVASFPLMNGTTFNITAALFSTSVDPYLAAFYGMPSGSPWTGAFGITFLGTGSPPGAFSSTAIGGGSVIASTDPIASTPEPLSIVLLGTTLLGCALIWRRQLRKS
jgi:hypothetical protein